jgi:GntR family transcriptional regulator / MocR family aminotransferase
MEISRTVKSDKSTFDTAIAAIALVKDDPAPLHIQLAAELKRLILKRILPSGARLPASRPLAEELGVSRVTVVSAVNELIAEGYAEGRRGSGVFVASDLPEQTLLSAPSVAAVAPLFSLFSPLSPLLSPLRHSAPEVRLFPHETWARLVLRVWRDPSGALLGHSDPAGFLPLRQAIAEHLALFRGMRADAVQVIVTSGAAEAVEVIARTLLKPGDPIFIEEPGYPQIWHTLRELALSPIHVPVDLDGFDIARAKGEAAAALVTPSRHFPTGATMPLSRRLALIEWAKREDGWIIEDDYDSEYRYRGRPMPALQSLDERGRVIYAGSFSKTMLPGLRLGFLVAPPALVQRLVETIAARGPRASLMMQPVLSHFMAEGHYGAHIRRMRRLYAKRQAVLLGAIDRDARGILSAEPEPAGMHLVCTLMNGMDDREAEARARSAGITAAALSGYFTGEPTRQGLLLGYAGFDEKTIEEAVLKLADRLR